ncbi:CBASS cGAMP synthase [Persicirhabdus sediminis]|uniref:Cyclic GMP-AMP synthase n=1 Tax=Persicirhabdus sediminis TaxID=454144 RepID=A0A8J7ME56_9BACT|nr:hypothetical protein [Persicirhabdus sediminis]MBK1791352.1 hypothetical protein [Persicirhabdus sediminis]
MNTHNLFISFNKKIKLTDSKKKKLESNRDALRQKIRDYFEEKDWSDPKFHSQGSYPLDTNLNPIKGEDVNGDPTEEYDLDDGVYFICKEADRKNPETYHDRIKAAVEGHTDQPVIDKSTCVRVTYADGHHIDLPSYWMENDDDTPQLAHKSQGYTDSDPREFKNWVDQKISDSSEVGQLRRIIRYLKAWKDHRETQNSSLKLPSGFILTILACNNYVSNSNDDAALRETVRAIKEELDRFFCCYRPTTPCHEDLLSGYKADNVKDEFTKLLNQADLAKNEDCEYEASLMWRKSLGDRFPLGLKKEEETKSANHSNKAVAASNPWRSQ